jgi:hypothetical protein
MAHEKLNSLDDLNAVAGSLARLAEAMEKSQTPTIPGGLTQEQFAQTLENQRKALNPINPIHPGISAYSYPEGDRARPKPHLVCDQFYENNAPLREDQLSPEEIESYNRVANAIPKPGDRLLAWDGRLKAERTDNGRRVMITFPTKSVDDLNRANGVSILFRNMALVEGEAAANPNSILQRLLAAEAEIQKLRTAQPVGA